MAHSDTGIIDLDRAQKIGKSLRWIQDWDRGGAGWSWQLACHSPVNG